MTTKEDGKLETKVATDRYGRAFVRELDVKGKKHRVYVNDDGDFIAYINKASGNADAGTNTEDHFSTETLEAPSIDALRKRLLKAMASHRHTIRVPFWVYRSGQEYRYSTRRATEKLTPTFVTNWIYGVHGSNDNALVEDEKGGRSQWSSYGSDTFRGDMPEAIRARYCEIAIETHKLHVEQEKIEEEWKIRVETVAKEAIEQVVGE